MKMWQKTLSAASNTAISANILEGETMARDYGKLSTEQLELLLCEDIEGKENLDTETVLQICAILTERKPPKTDARESFRRFVANYLDPSEQP